MKRQLEQLVGEVGGCSEVVSETEDDKIRQQPPASIVAESDHKYAHFIGNDDDRPVRAHEDELTPHSLFYSLAQRRKQDVETHTQHPIPISCSRDVLRSVVATMRTGEVMVLGDSNIEELFETMRATCLIDNPFNKLLELDTNTLVHFMAHSGFSTAVTTEYNLQKSERAARKTRLLWNQFAHTLRNWPSLRRALRECTRGDSPISDYVAPGAARIHVNTSINDQGRQFILRCLCEHVATMRLRPIETNDNERTLLERFADEEFVNEFIKTLLNSPYGPFWFMVYEPMSGRALKIDKKIKRLVCRILTEPSTDLDEQTVMGNAITCIRKLWGTLCQTIPRLEAYLGLCEEEDTNEMRLLKEVFHEHGMKLVKHERVRRMMGTSRLLSFPVPDVLLDSIDAIITIHFK